MTGPRRPSPERQYQHTVLAKVVRGVAWSPEHRCLHSALVGGFCRQHQLREQVDQLPHVDVAAGTQAGLTGG